MVLPTSDIEYINNRGLGRFHGPRCPAGVLFLTQTLVRVSAVVVLVSLSAPAAWAQDGGGLFPSLTTLLLTAVFGLGGSIASSAIQRLNDKADIASRDRLVMVETQIKDLSEELDALTGQVAADRGAQGAGLARVEERLRGDAQRADERHAQVQAQHEALAAEMALVRRRAEETAASSAATQRDVARLASHLMTPTRAS